MGTEEEKKEAPEPEEDILSDEDLSPLPSPAPGTAPAEEDIDEIDEDWGEV